ncbi:MAG: uracil-DNA glycosylase [Opitutaceae bacterium]
MSTGLDAVYDELKRLQKEGLDRVYINDSTASLLKPVEPKVIPVKQISAQDTAALADLIDKPTPRAEAAKPTISVVEIDPLPEAPTIQLPDDAPIAQLKWLEDSVRNCATCNERKNEDEQLVFGNGAIDADILFCGEAPGTDEAMSGLPFVGAAGQLLDKIIKAMGLDREKVYCTNILKWRPKNDKPYGNRPPTQDEMAFCLPYLQAQLDIIQPKVIVALGNNTVGGLLGEDAKRKFGSLRGQWDTFHGIPLMITFHPSYLQRNDTLKTKRMAWEDLLAVMGKVDLPISEKQQGYFLK